MEDFVPYELAKKLKEKGFSCEIPFAMYNEIARFHLLTTAAPMTVCASGFKCREYYDYEDFDEHGYIAPTIYQVLKWLREEYRLHIEPRILTDSDVNADTYWKFSVLSARTGYTLYYEYNHIDDKRFETYEAAALAGVAYCLENLI